MQQVIPARPVGALELTVRGVIIGGLITLVFTAANVFLGLKVGLTFASSIPAAVISMAVLRAFKNSTIYENNIVQTVASAAGTLSAIIFVLPGLVIVGWWTHFPFWESFAITAAGGILGVMYSVPLRRALVTGTNLPFPEGVAAAEVLRVGAGEKSEEFAAENKLGLHTLVVSSIVSALLQILTAIKLLTAEFSAYVKVGIGSAVSGMAFSTSLALVGAGHLIGLTVGVAIGVGLAIAWFILIPIISYLHGVNGVAGDIANAIRGHDVRFIGAGVIGIAAIWALARLIGPVWGGIQSSIAASKARGDNGGASLPITEQDLPLNWVIGISLVAFIPIGILLWTFLNGGVLQSMAVPLMLSALLYIVIVGFFVAATAGYMAALIGASNSPVSGMAILSVIGAALVILVVVGRNAAPTAGPALVAYALFVTAILLNVATISNDNLQDLKTGQLVGATPWRQQIALVFGVLFGSLIIPITLDLLNQAYTFGDKSPLQAPQAHLISALAQGVIQGTIDWNLIWIGCGIGAIVIVIDEIGRITGKYRMPPMAVGLGVYLPPTATAPVVVGAVMGKLYNNWVENKKGGEGAKRLGVLVASGFIVGESLWGVLNAGIIVLAQRGYLHVADPANPLGLFPDSFAGVAMILAVLAFLGFAIATYRWIGMKARSL